MRRGAPLWAQAGMGMGVVDCPASGEVTYLNSQADSLAALYMLPVWRLGMVCRSRVFTNPAWAAISSHLSWENGCGTQGLPRSVPYSTTTSVPPGRSILRTDSSTGALSFTK